MPIGSTPVATESEAATLKLTAMAADVFPTSQTSLLKEPAQLPNNTFFPPILNLPHWWILEVKRTEPWGYIPATGAGEGDTHSIMS